MRIQVDRHINEDVPNGPRFVLTLTLSVASEERALIDRFGAVPLENELSLPDILWQAFLNGAPWTRTFESPVKANEYQAELQEVLRETTTYLAAAATFVGSSTLQSAL
jgi:hypothetical protein